MPSISTPVTITAPTGVDGRAEVATLNNSADSNFVGYLYKATGFGGAPVRLSKDAVPEGHGAIFGTNYLGERSFTLEVALQRASTFASSDTRWRKLTRACDAKASDGTLSWTDADSYVRFVLFRLEQGPSDPDPENAHSLMTGVCPDPRIYGGTSPSAPPVVPYFLSASTSHTINNHGNTDSPYLSMGIAAPTATTTITNTTTGQTFTFTGLNGLGAIDLNFRTRVLNQGGTNKPGSITSSSSWITLAPGNNSITCSPSMSAAWFDAWSAA